VVRWQAETSLKELLAGESLHVSLPRLTVGVAGLVAAYKYAQFKRDPAAAVGEGPAVHSEPGGVQEGSGGAVPWLVILMLAAFKVTGLHPVPTTPCPYYPLLPPVPITPCAR
jgi:hypothetical protein